MPKYHSTADALKDLQDSIERIEHSPKESPSRALGIFAVAGIDGKLTGSDVLISIAGLAFGLVASIVWGLSKLADGARARDALGSGTDVMAIVVIVLLARFLADVTSLPTILASIFNKPVKEPPVEPTVVREAVFTNRKVKKETLVGLPNGEVIGAKLFAQYLETVCGQAGTVWSKEEWCNQPTDPKRKGRGLMTQVQWAGVKELLVELGVWRSSETGDIESVLEDYD